MLSKTLVEVLIIIYFQCLSESIVGHSLHLTVSNSFIDKDNSTPYDWAHSIQNVGNVDGKSLENLGRSFGRALDYKSGGLRFEICIRYPVVRWDFIYADLPFLKLIGSDRTFL